MSRHNCLYNILFSNVTSQIIMQLTDSITKKNEQNPKNIYIKKFMIFKNSLNRFFIIISFFKHFPYLPLAEPTNSLLKL